jgi:hypothetical protein
LLDALEDNLLLAPIQSSVVPFLRRNDKVMRRIMNTIEMPDRMAEIWSGSSASTKAS